MSSKRKRRSQFDAEVVRFRIGGPHKEARKPLLTYLPYTRVSKEGDALIHEMVDDMAKDFAKEAARLPPP